MYCTFIISPHWIIKQLFLLFFLLSDIQILHNQYYHTLHRNSGIAVDFYIAAQAAYGERYIYMYTGSRNQITEKKKGCHKQWNKRWQWYYYDFIALSSKLTTGNNFHNQTRFGCLKEKKKKKKVALLSNGEKLWIRSTWPG